MHYCVNADARTRLLHLHSDARTRSSDALRERNTQRGQNAAITRTQHATRPERSHYANAIRNAARTQPCKRGTEGPSRAPRRPPSSPSEPPPGAPRGHQSHGRTGGLGERGGLLGSSPTRADPGRGSVGDDADARRRPVRPPAGIGGGWRPGPGPGPGSVGDDADAAEVAEVVGEVGARARDEHEVARDLQRVRQLRST